LNIRISAGMSYVNQSSLSLAIELSPLDFRTERIVQNDSTLHLQFEGPVVVSRAPPSPFLNRVTTYGLVAEMFCALEAQH